MSSKKRSKFEAAIRAHRDDEAVRLVDLSMGTPSGSPKLCRKRAPFEDDPNYRYVSVSE